LFQVNGRNREIFLKMSLEKNHTQQSTVVGGIDVAPKCMAMGGTPRGKKRCYGTTDGEYDGTIFAVVADRNSNPGPGSHLGAGRNPLAID
jgi:hypothetical protein